MEYGQIVLWLAMFVGLSAVALPITSKLFARFPTRGAGFAPTVAFGIVALVAYWVGHLRFGYVALGAGLVVLGAVSVLSVRRDADLDWRPFGEAMAAFGVAFLLIVAVRAVDPGIIPFFESFLDYGMMRAVLRASHLPPEDFWFAGMRVRYHYGGHLVAALQTMLTGTAPAVAYNLSLAGFYAMLVAGAYELSAMIAAANGRSRYAAGVLGAYFVGLAGNLLVPVTVVVWMLPRRIRPAIAEASATGLGDPARDVVVHGMSEFEYWDVLNMIPDALTTFPLFTWLHGELHAHMNSAPFLMLLAAVCYAYYRTPETARQTRRALAFVGVPLAAGYTLLSDMLAAPTTMGVFWLTLIFAPAGPAALFPERLRARWPAQFSILGSGVTNKWWRAELQRVAAAVAITGIVTVLVVIISAPSLLATSGGKESLAFVSGTERTGIAPLVLVHGAFVAVFALYFGHRLRADAEKTPLSDQTTPVAGVLTLAAVSSAIFVPALLVFVPLLAVGWYLLRTDRANYENVLIIAGIGLVLIVEFVYISNQEYVVPGRGNTVFRTYWHAWLFWGVAAGVIVPGFVRRANRSWRVAPSRRSVYAVFAVLLVSSTAAYGVVSLHEHFTHPLEPPTEEWRSDDYVYEATQLQGESPSPTNPPTLDGLLYADVRYPNETLAIEWLDRNVRGTPTMVTAPGGRWEWRSAPAALTGIPTVAGWGHELVYREWDTYYGRVADVKSIYEGTPEQRIALLEQYDVRYVYVGSDERERYDVWEFSLLDGVTVVYQNRDAVIYNVRPSALEYSPGPANAVNYSATDLTANASVAAARNGSIVASAAENGSGSGETLAWWGPYDTLQPGDYVATFRLDVNATESNSSADQRPLATVDVARGTDKNGTAKLRVLGNTTVNETDGVRNVSVPFTVTRPVSDLELRGWLADETANVTLYNVSVQPKNERGTPSENRTRFRPVRG